MVVLLEYCIVVVAVHADDEVKTLAKNVVVELCPFVVVDQQAFLLLYS